MAVIRNSTTKNQLAKIVDIRIARDTSDDDDQIIGRLRGNMVEEMKAIDIVMEDVSANKDAQITTDGKEMKFDYYVHYVGE